MSKMDELKKMLDEAEMMGYDRGVKTILIEILKEIEAHGATAISAKSIKAIHDKLLEVSNQT